MRKKILTALSLILLIFTIVTCHKGEKVQDASYRFIYNNDGTEILGNRWHGFRPLTIEDVHSYVDVVANTGITTYMICSGSMLVYYESEYERPLGLPRPGSGIEACNNEHYRENIPRYGRNYLRLRKEGTDIIELCVNRAKEKGLEAFITMRMNDLHFTDPALYCTAAQSDIWLDHPEWRMGNHPGWHADGALNYAHQGVRDYRLNLIREQCESYDIDGMELDFMRFIVYFPYRQGRDYLDLMTNFMRQAKQIVDQAGELRGRPMLLAVRVPAQYELCIDKGLDVSRWSDEGLIDMITVSAHWIGDPALPIRHFKSQLNADHIPVYASLESGQYYPREDRSHGIYRGAASHCLHQGADGIYLFNYFLSEFTGVDYQPAKPSNGLSYTNIRDTHLLSELGRLENMSGRNKVFSLSDGISEYEYTPDTPLPVSLYSWNQVELHMEVGDDLSTEKPANVYLFLRTRKDAALKISCNGTATSDASPCLSHEFGRDMNLGADDTVIVRKVPVDALRQGGNVIAIRSYDPVPAVLNRLELALQYGPVEEKGCF
ncbi:MAG: hypothetical protein V2J62_08175 [candidate division KSB1 bacterium]|nr:hypothetical protein [candidate division KSB1 bacterium]